MRAVKDGKDPLGIHRDPNYRIRTRTQNTFVHAPAAATPEADLLLLKQVGRQVAEAEGLQNSSPV
jgi:hypothetical protein